MRYFVERCLRSQNVGNWEGSFLVGIGSLVPLFLSFVRVSIVEGSTIVCSCLDLIYKNFLAAVWYCTFVNLCRVLS